MEHYRVDTEVKMLQMAPTFYATSIHEEHPMNLA